jgi:hypothetical protein
MVSAAPQPVAAVWSHDEREKKALTVVLFVKPGLIPGHLSQLPSISLVHRRLREAIESCSHSLRECCVRDSKHKDNAHSRAQTCA